jgi:lipopolysaccharide export system permease protein
MMLIDKYLLRRFLGPLAYCLLTFSMLVVIWDLFDHLGAIIKARPSVVLVLRYYLGVLCPSLEYLTPACLLLAAIYALWQLTRSNELIAMRVSGISMYRMMLPFLGVGLVFSIANMIIGMSVAPQTALWTAEFYQNKFKVPEQVLRFDQPYYNINGRRQWTIGKIDLRNSHSLRRVKVTQERKDGTRALDIMARKAEWLDGQWWFYGIQQQKYNEDGSPDGTLTPAIPDLTCVRQLAFLNEKPADFVNEAKSWDYYTYAEMLRYLRYHSSLSGSDVAQKNFDVDRRLAMPWACLIVTLFGIPAGTSSARQSALSGVFLAVAFFLGFYAVSQVGTYLGIRQTIPAWLGAWLSNIVFMITGIYMLVKMR